MANGSDPKPDHPLNFGFGVLNPIEPPKIFRRFLQGETKVMHSLMDAAREVFKPDAITSTGPYKAIVLRIEKEPESDAGVADWLSSFLDGKKSNAPTMVRLKARIPELHAMLPIPTGDGNQTGPHQQVIDMYPTFMAQSDLIPEPSVGDLVWVNFGNKTNFSDPIYVKPLLEKEGMTKALGIDEIRKQLAALGCTGGLGVTSPSGDSRGGANRATSPHRGLPKGARTTPVGEPKTIRGEGASEKLAVAWETASQSNNIPMTTWIGTLPSNGNRHMLVFAPLTTDFTKPVELAYVFHGAKSWVPGPAWTGPEGIYGGGVLGKMILDGRNIVFGHPQLPFAGGCKSPCITGGTNGKGGSGTQIFDKLKGGDFTALHADVLRIIGEHFSKDAPPNINFISITSHSKGVDALHAAIKHGHLANVKPDKITHADIYGGAFLSHFKQRMYTYNEYVLNKNGLGTDKYVEVNDVTATGKRAANKESGTSAIKFFREALGVEVGPDTGTKQVAKGKFTYNYSPHSLSHGALAAVGIGYVAPAPPLPPPGTGTSTVGAFAGNANLKKVVVFGTSLIGQDLSDSGGLGKALKNTLAGLGAQEIIVKGVASAKAEYWINGSFKPADKRPNAQGATVQKMADLNADVYFVAIGGNDWGSGMSESKTNKFLDNIRTILNTLSQDKSKPIVWYGHVYEGSAKVGRYTLEEVSAAAQNLYRAIDEKLRPEYPNLLVQWPKTETLREIYLSASRQNAKTNLKQHPSSATHQAFIDAGKADLFTFLGLGAGAAQTEPSDNATSSPTREEHPPDGPGPGIGPKLNEIQMTEITQIVAAAIDGYTNDEDWTNIVNALKFLNRDEANILEFKQFYIGRPLRDVATRDDILVDLNSESLDEGHQVAMHAEALTLLDPLPNPPPSPNPPATDGEGAFSPSGDDTSSPSERPASSSTEASGSVSGSAATAPTGPKIKYLDLVRSESKRIGIEFETGLGFIKAESGGKTICPNGRMLVRFEPHVFINHGISGNRGKGYGLKGKESQVPWYGCKGTRCSQWLNVGPYTHVSNCNGNWETEVVKNIGAAVKVAQDLGLDPDLPYVAASFGTGQVMGFNHRHMGYPSAKAMFDDWSTNEVAQIKGIFSYFEKKPGMLAAVKAKDWDKMARLYNGCRDNCTSADGTKGYGPKLERAYNLYKSGDLPPNRELGSAGPGGAGAGGAVSSGVSAGSAGGGCSPGGAAGGGVASAGAGATPFGAGQRGGKVVQGEFPPNPDGLYPGQPPAILPVYKGNWSAIYGTPGTNSYKGTVIDWQHNDRLNSPKINGRHKPGPTIPSVGSSRPGGCPVNALAAKAFMLVDHEIEQLRKIDPEVAAYHFYVNGTAGGCGTAVHRCKHNSKFKKGDRPPNCPSGISLHSYGIAIDVNPHSNVFTKHSSKATKDVPGGWQKGDLVTDQPRGVVGAFKRYGFTWGGDWNGSKDAMHYEFRGDPKVLDQVWAAIGQPAAVDPDAAAGATAEQTPNDAPAGTAVFKEIVYTAQGELYGWRDTLGSVHEGPPPGGYPASGNTDQNTAPA